MLTCLAAGEGKLAPPLPHPPIPLTPPSSPHTPTECPPALSLLPLSELFPLSVPVTLYDT